MRPRDKKQDIPVPHIWHKSGSLFCWCNSWPITTWSCTGNRSITSKVRLSKLCKLLVLLEHCWCVDWGQYYVCLVAIYECIRIMCQHHFGDTTLFGTYVRHQWMAEIWAKFSTCECQHAPNVFNFIWCWCQCLWVALLLWWQHTQWWSETESVQTSTNRSHNDYKVRNYTLMPAGHWGRQRLTFIAYHYCTIVLLIITLCSIAVAVTLARQENLGYSLNI